MLLGTHEHTIDDKFRLTLPAKFRQEFEDHLDGKPCPFAKHVEVALV